MSKPIDQEREAFERHYRAKHDGFMPSCFGGEYDWNDAQSCWETWQARAAVQPAGVAVPGWLVSPHGESAVRVSNVLFGSVCFSEEEADGRMAVLLEFLRAMLAAAPHPVSGEQKPFTYVTVLEGRIQRQGSEAHCQEWADAWNESCGDQGKASVEPLFRSPPAAQLGEQS